MTAAVTGKSDQWNCNWRGDTYYNRWPLH